MATFNFTLIVNGPDLQDDSHIDALFEVGCDDAAVGSSDGVQYVDFDREASNFDQAVLSAVEDLEKMEGVEVVRIADAGLVSLADIAVHVGRTRESVRLLVSGARGPGGFPRPVTDPRTRYRLWRWSEVADWFKGYSRDHTAILGDDLTATFNAALEFRHHLRLRAPSDSIALRDLLDMPHPTGQSGSDQQEFAPHAPSPAAPGRTVDETVSSKQLPAMTAEYAGTGRLSRRGATTLSLHGKRMDTVFHLLGSNENSMTMSLGWCLSQVPSFLDCLGDALGTPDPSAHDAVVRLQEYQRGTGKTDLEVYAPGYTAWVIEAKRGLMVPSMTQLRKYATRLAELKDRSAARRLVVLTGSDRKDQWLLQRLPDEIDGIPVRALSWRRVQRMAAEARSSVGRSGQSLLEQLHTYLGSESNMQDQNSNWVYVVSLSNDTFGGETTFVDVVEKHRKYFHPVGGDRSGWPVEPPNYMGFRYHGHLQSIHHVDDYEVITDFGPFFPNQPSEALNPYFLYHLGPPIRPVRDIPAGKSVRFANRVWCFIDTLLTSDTISDALTATKTRERTPARNDLERTRDAQAARNRT